MLGRPFESLVTLSVRTYAQLAESRVFQLRTRNGDHEVDLIVERPDGRIVALEIKLGTSVDIDDVTHLSWLRERVGDDLLDSVVITTGPYAYRRTDGIAVVPAAHQCDPTAAHGAVWQATHMASVGEEQLRVRIMHALAEAAAETGYVTRAQLSALDVDGMPRRIIDQSRGIWNPRDLQATLTVVSSPSGPYDDQVVGDSLFTYDYRAGTVRGDNTKLRRAYELELPIILLRKIETGIYVPVFPVYVVADDQASRQFVLALDESLRFLRDPMDLSAQERRYAQRVVRQRLHQPEFRGRVLRAYQTRCAVCTLKHGRLLDAAHIVGDGEEGGDPIVVNGLSLCKIHHAAYDTNLLGIAPDYVVHVNRELLEEQDGPMLKHGLQEMNQRPLTVPSRATQRPDRERLARRYDTFRAAS
ncbi:MAG: DUF4143 domain-containing protein [Nocardioidaceae bacterium]